MDNIKKLGLFLLLVCVALGLASCAPDYTYTSGFGTPKNIKQYKKAGSLWTALGDNFYLPDESDSNPAVAAQIQWFMKNPVYVQKMAQSAAPFLYYIYQQVKKRHLPAELTLLPMVESAYDPFATNYGSGAAGLWQMIPSTASGFGLRLDWWYDGRRDVIASTNAALNYFVFLGKFFDNDWLLAIAAYDSGEGTVEEAIQRNAAAGKLTSFWYLSLPYETETYVPKLLALATIIKHPHEYPVHLPDVKNAPQLALVNVGSQIDLARAAKMAGMSLETLASYNPGFNRWATDPNGPHTLVLPIDSAARFNRELKRLPKSQRVSLYRVIVEKGDTLDSFAHKYHSSPAIIKRVNHLRNNTIHPGQALLVPSGRNNMASIVINNEKNFYKSFHHVRLLKITRHTVRKGESLWSIAKKYHVTVRQLRFWNNLSSNYVAPGTSLIVWPPHSKKNPTYWMPTFHHYTVKKGDSVWGIAYKYHISIRTLVLVNAIKHDHLTPGQILKIPVAHQYIEAPHTSKHKKSKTRPLTIYHVKAGDYINKIAHKFDMSTKALMRLNHLTPHSILHKGQRLKVYTQTSRI